MIVKFSQVENRIPSMSCQAELFRSRKHLKEGKSFFTSLERLEWGAKSCAERIKAENQQDKVELIFSNNFPASAKEVVNRVLTRHKVNIS